MVVSAGMSVLGLVHGSFHDGSAWDGVIQRLQHRGHTAYGPTVAGHGKEASKKISHAESTQSIVEFIVDNDLSDVVLVGHSYDGTIISKVVEAIPDRVRRLVYFSATFSTMAKASSTYARRIIARCSLSSRRPRRTTPSWCHSPCGV